MNGVGRFVVGVGATALGLIAAFIVAVVLSGSGDSGWWALLSGVLELVVFGLVAAAFYTWSVDGAFIFRRNRPGSTRAIARPSSDRGDPRRWRGHTWPR